MSASSPSPAPHSPTPPSPRKPAGRRRRGHHEGLSLPRRISQRVRRWRLLEEVAVQIFYGAIQILGALPSRWVLKLGDFFGTLLGTLDRRGRRVAFENMKLALGEGMSDRERDRILRASSRNIVRSIALLLHLQPLTARRFYDWVDAPDMHAAPEAQRVKEKGGVLVSGHIGNWELLLGLRILFDDFPPSVFLAEEIPHEAFNRVLKKLRSHGNLKSALRKGGARAVINVVAAGGSAGLLVDRNVRRQLGGIYAPFFGRRARTTPLPAWLALRYEVPLHPIFLFPEDDGRYRLWMGPDLTQDLEGSDHHSRMVEVLTRVNGVFEEIIRAQPELWNWTLKRWKSRPNVELEGYPSYSLWDPDRKDRTRGVTKT